MSTSQGPPFLAKKAANNVTWPQLGTQDQSEIAQNTIQKLIFFGMVFGMDFGCLMARFLGPTWLPKSD